MSNLLAEQNIDDARRQAALAATRLKIISASRDSAVIFAANLRVPFQDFWEGSREDVQERADTFRAGEIQAMFAAHQAAMQFLAVHLPGFTPPSIPYSFSWGEDGRLIVGGPV